MTYTVVCGTNRKDALSLTVSQVYYGMLEHLGLDTHLIELSKLPEDFTFSALYENRNKNEAFNRFDRLMQESDKFVFVVPEYNGSFPGVLKTFIDGLTFPITLRDKKAAIVSLASGGHGGSLAASHLTDVLNHCGTNVLAFKPRLHHIEEFIEGGMISSKEYREMLELQVKLFTHF